MPHIYLNDSKLTPRHAIRVARKASGLTQRQVSEHAGVTPECVAHWEHARHDSRTETFLAAIEACGYQVVIRKKRK